MQTLARLFGRSPFAPLQTHMEKVAVCVRELPALFEALEKKDYELLAQMAKKISKLEHDADLAKNDIRNNLPTGLFLAISRASLLEILALQDHIADRVEDLAIVLTLRDLEIQPQFTDAFRVLWQKNMETFEGVYRIICEMDQLLESSFGGAEAEKVRIMVEEVAFKEHEADLLQRDLLKIMYRHCDEMNAPRFFLWMKVVEELASLSDESEKLANRVRMTLEVK